MTLPSLAEFTKDFDAVYLTAEGDPHTPLDILHDTWGIHAVMRNGKNFEVTLRGCGLEDLPRVLRAMVEIAAEADAGDIDIEIVEEVER